MNRAAYLASAVALAALWDRRGQAAYKHVGSHGVQEHRYMKGGGKTVCTSYVLAAFGIPPHCYHYAGTVDQRAALLRKHGWAVRSRDSRVGLNKTAKRGKKVTVSQVAKAIQAANADGKHGKNAWGDPITTFSPTIARGTRYMLRVRSGNGTHAMLLDDWGTTIVDTAPRKVDRREVLKVQAVYRA